MPEIKIYSSRGEESFKLKFNLKANQQTTNRKMQGQAYKRRVIPETMIEEH